MAMWSEPKPPLPSTIPFRIRPFQREDADQARDLFRLTIGYERGSSRWYALRGNWTRPNSIVCYILFLVGLCLVYSAKLDNPVMQAGGIILSALSATYFFVQRWAIGDAFRRHSDTRNHPDFEDIGAHYGVVMNKDGTSSIIGRSGFWVAELLTEEGKPTGRIVGTVGLDDRFSADPTNAELRRMTVASSMQRRGLGRLLIETVLHHVKLHNFKTITLQTTGYSKSATGIYERFGWKLTKETGMPGKPWVDMRLVSYQLEI